MSTVITNGVSMTQKERITELIGGHLLSTEEELKEAQARFGAAILNDDSEAAKYAGNKCRKLEGQQQALDLVIGLLEKELV